MKKCIALVRVSTEQQSYDEQERELIEFAKSDGYDEVISVAEKESGIKLREEERKGLNRMKELIESDNEITAVYIYHIDRLSRRKSVLFSIVEWLQTHKIQLVVKDPSIRLFNDDGTVNDMADMVFSLFATISESEMRIKKSRFHRSRQANVAAGKYNGGSLALGYTVDENNYIVIDEEGAKTVRNIYHMFTEQLMSLRAISKELKSIGVNKTFTGVQTILTNDNYTGNTKYHLPAIIDEATFSKAAEMLSKHKTVYVKKNSYNALCRRMLYSNEYNAMLTTHKDFYEVQDASTKSHNLLCIKIDILDKFIWTDAAMIYADEITANRETTVNGYKNELEIIEKKLAVIDKELEKFSNKIDNITDLYIDGIITKEKMIEKKEKVQQEQSELDKTRLELTKQKDNIINIMESDNEIDEIELCEKNFNEIFLKYGFEEMKKIVDHVISKVEITGGRAHKHIRIYHNNHTVRDVDYNSHCWKGNKWVNDEISFY